MTRSSSGVVARMRLRRALACSSMPTLGRVLRLLSLRVVTKTAFRVLPHLKTIRSFSVSNQFVPWHLLMVKRFSNVAIDSNSELKELSTTTRMLKRLHSSIRPQAVVLVCLVRRLRHFPEIQPMRLSELLTSRVHLEEYAWSTRDA